MRKRQFAKQQHRTKSSWRKYMKWRNNVKPTDVCVLCTAKPIQVFKYWKIIKNDFPYDNIAKIHHMLVPFRHATEETFNKKELDEFKIIKNSIINKKYSWILEATSVRRSIPAHFHLHLLLLKGD